jgi:4-hydroxybenzoyl-CoA thioesterase
VDGPLGIGYRALILDRRVGLPTVHLEADFRAVSRLGDRVRLTLKVERLGQRSLTLKLACMGEDDELRMEMRQVIVTTSLLSHEAIDIPDDLRSAIRRGVPALA